MEPALRVHAHLVCTVKVALEHPVAVVFPALHVLLVSTTLDALEHPVGPALSAHAQQVSIHQHALGRQLPAPHVKLGTTEKQQTMLVHAQRVELENTPLFQEQQLHLHAPHATPARMLVSTQLIAE